MNQFINIYKKSGQDLIYLVINDGADLEYEVKFKPEYLAFQIQDFFWDGNFKKKSLVNQKEFNEVNQVREDLFLALNEIFENWDTPRFLALEFSYNSVHDFHSVFSIKKVLGLKN